MNLSATVKAFERQGVARTLAEPTVTAVSGESAKFLAGGTIPILNGESCTTNKSMHGVDRPAALWREPELHPVVLSQSRIQLRIATEVTDVDTSHTFAVAGTSGVPGFRTRKNETTVELPSAGRSRRPDSFQPRRSRRSPAFPV